MEQENEIKAVVKRAAKEIARFYNGNSWVADNFSEKVLSISPAEALKKVKEHSHSVAQLVSHITAWRNFALQKLTGNDNYDIRDESSDWPGSSNWDSVCEGFKLCHQNLLTAIESFPVNRWNSGVPGRNYSFLFLLNGIIQHDYYHYGQIGSVLAGIKNTGL